jgi:peptide/nickel transport system substrate-binding protein
MKWNSATHCLTAWIFLAAAWGLEAKAETPRDTVIVGFESIPKSGDPRLIGGDANSQYLEELSFLPLISFDENSAIRYVVAESVVPEGNKAWKARIRSGLRFANGRELNADDVVAMYKYILAADSNPPFARRNAFEKLLDVKKIGSAEVLFTMKEPDAPFVANLTIGILPQEALKAPPEKLMGQGFESGPFVLEKAGSDEWIFKKNESFNSTVFGGVPKISRAIFKIISDNGTRYAALLRGDLDIVQNTIDTDKVVQIQKDMKNKFKVVTKPGFNTTYLAFNFKNRNFEKLAVRQAIAKAIHIDEILQFSMQGMGIRATGMFPPAFAYHDPSLAGSSYDPEGAKKLLDEAGFKDPDGKGPQTRFSFKISVTTNKERVAVAKAIASQLKAVGLGVDVETLETATFSDRLAKGMSAAWVAPWTGYKDPEHLAFCFHSKKMPPQGANRGFYSNAKVDELLDKGESELEIKKRLPFYLEAQKLLAADQPYVYLWHKLSHAVVGKNVEGYQLYADGRYTFLVNIEKK